MYKVNLLVNKKYREQVFSDKYYTRIKKSAQLSVYDKDDFEDKQDVLNFLRGADVLITSWGTIPLTGEVLSVCSNLKAVIHAGGTVKPLLTDEFLAKNIRITNSAIALGQGVAETALGFAISACKGFYSLGEDTSNGLWQENIQSKVKDFYDITVGVVGGGFVGRHMIKLLNNFHVDVLLYDPFVTKEQAQQLGAQKSELDDLIACSDVISVHAPQIPETYHMFNSERIAMIKDGAVLINTARGSVIDEKALISELKKNRFFACIDVTDPEPPDVKNELRSLKNVVLTPHIAGACTNGLRRVALHVCEELERFCKGELMKTEIDLRELSKLA